MTITTFPEAQAVGICWMANFRGAIKPPEWDGLHSERCGWCEYPQPVKMTALEAYNRTPTAERQRAAFFAMGPTTRRKAIRHAQGYEEAAP